MNEQHCVDELMAGVERHLQVAGRAKAKHWNIVKRCASKLTDEQVITTIGVKGFEALKQSGTYVPPSQRAGAA